MKLYGDAGDRFPIQYGETWKAGTNKVFCWNLLQPFSVWNFLDQKGLDLVYCDPPWNAGNLKCFINKAGYPEPFSFPDLIDGLIERIRESQTKVAYMEMGLQNCGLVYQKITDAGGRITDEWDITYYRRNPCRLLRFSFSPGKIKTIARDFFTGMDDEATPLRAIQREDARRVADFCTGRGLTGRSAFISGAQFYGIELHPRRLAWLLDFYNKQGLIPGKTINEGMAQNG